MQNPYNLLRQRFDDTTKQWHREAVNAMATHEKWRDRNTDNTAETVGNLKLIGNKQDSGVNGHKVREYLFREERGIAGGGGLDSMEVSE